MSKTNRSFIKAYRHDTAQPSATPASPTTTGTQGASKRAAVGIPAAAENVSGGASSSPAIGERRSAADKAPLSSFIPRTQPAGRVGEPQRNDTFEPGTTVASFAWPAVCRTLLVASGPQLDQVARTLVARADAGHSLVGILGLFPKIGSTTTAMCLASRAANRSRRVILADGNFRSPRVASWLDAVPTAGWEEVLKHTAPLSDAVVHATDDNLDVLALGAKPVKDPQPLVTGLQAAVTAGVLRHAYQLVLIDLGVFFEPVSQPTVLELVANMGIDGVIAIAGPEPADPRDLATVAEHLGHSGCELLGTIENRVAKPQAA